MPRQLTRSILCLLVLIAVASAQQNINVRPGDNGRMIVVTPTNDTGVVYLPKLSNTVEQWQVTVNCSGATYACKVYPQAGAEINNTSFYQIAAGGTAVIKNRGTDFRVVGAEPSNNGVTTSVPGLSGLLPTGATVNGADLGLAGNLNVGGTLLDANGRPITTGPRLAAPAGFGWQTQPVAIYQIGSAYVTSFDVSSYAPRGKAYYVSTTGNDSNDGLTAATPLRKISTAQAKSDVDVVYVAPGWYDKANTVSLFGPTRSQSVIGTGAGVYISQDTTGLTYSLNGSHYESSTSSQVAVVIDISGKDPHGDFRKYTLQASSAAVDSNAGSFYWAANVLYIHTFDNRAPDDSVKIYDASTYYSVWHSNAVRYYLENLTSVGGRLGGIFVAGGKDILAKNVNIMGSGSFGLRITGANVLSIMQGVVASANDDDGFNYDNINGFTNAIKAIEINCTGRDSSRTSGSEVVNGSTIHDQVYMVRLNGTYTRTFGPVVADVGGSQSWNIGSSASNSTAVTSKNDWVATDAGTVMWLDTTTSTPVSGGKDVDASVGAVIYVYGMSTITAASGRASTPYVHGFANSEGVICGETGCGVSADKPLSAAPGGTVPACATATIDFSNAAFRAASAGATIALATLPAGAIVTGTATKHSAVFGDGAGAMTDVTVSIGSAGGGATFYDSARSIGEATAVAATTLYSATMFKHYTSASEALNAVFASTGANFGNGSVTSLTSGVVAITYCYMVP